MCQQNKILRVEQMPLTRRRRTTRRPRMTTRRPKMGYRKTRGYRRKRVGRFLTNVIQAPVAYVKMKYSTTISLDAATGSVNSYIFRANSIFDPDYSGTGHQPSLHDLYQGLYNHYEVLNSRIVVRPLPAPETTGTQTGARIAQISIATLSSPFETNPGFESIREFKRGPVMFVNDNSVVNGKGSTISKYWSKRSWFTTNTPSSTGADFGSNPSAIAYFNVQQSAPASGFNPIDLQVLVDMYFTVKLTRPITQTQS